MESSVRACMDVLANKGIGEFTESQSQLSSICSLILPPACGTGKQHLVKSKLFWLTLSPHHSSAWLSLVRAGIMLQSMLTWGCSPLLHPTILGCSVSPHMGGSV